MEPRAFLENLQKHFGGRIDDEDPGMINSLNNERGLPNIEIKVRGFTLKVDFIIKEELMFTVYASPPRFLIIRAWNMFDRILSFFKLLGWTKFPVVDEDRFFLLYITPEDAKSYFSSQRTQIVMDLFPFVEIDQRERVYRCLKHVDIHKDYSVERCVKDINLLIDYVESTRTL